MDPNSKLAMLFYSEGTCLKHVTHVSAWAHGKLDSGHSGVTVTPAQCWNALTVRETLLFWGSVNQMCKSFIEIHF